MQHGPLQPRPVGAVQVHALLALPCAEGRHQGNCRAATQFHSRHSPSLVASQDVEVSKLPSPTSTACVIAHSAWLPTACSSRAFGHCRCSALSRRRIVDLYLCSSKVARVRPRKPEVGRPLCGVLVMRAALKTAFRGARSSNKAVCSRSGGILNACTYQNPSGKRPGLGSHMNVQ